MYNLIVASPYQPVTMVLGCGENRFPKKPYSIYILRVFIQTPIYNQR